MGNGLYGVDLKQSGDQVVVIEVNDNPNVDAGVEDLWLGEDLYRQIMVRKNKAKNPSMVHCQRLQEPRSRHRRRVCLHFQPLIASWRRIGRSQVVRQAHVLLQAQLRPHGLMVQLR